MGFRRIPVRGKDSACVFLILLLVVSVAMVGVGANPGTVLSVDPPEYIVPGPGLTFKINITVTNVTNLWEMTFKLWYNSTLINATDVIPGPVWSTHPCYPEFEDLTVPGRVLYAIGFADLLSFNGTGVVATIIFTAIAVGESVLHLNETMMYESHPILEIPIPHTTVDGAVRVRLMGDANDDGEVDMLDVGSVCSVYAAGFYVHTYDMNLDGFVNILDVGTVCSCYALWGG